jgi:tRNA dimethylallyltransferase
MSASGGPPQADRSIERKEGDRFKVVVLAGPTASGKTSMAVDLARDLSGEIVNADSMQVYRGMDIGTAKPTQEEQHSIPHHLLDVADPDEPFNAAAFRAMALAAVQEIHGRGKACFVVGGTGLYIKGLLGGLFKCPPSDPALRQSLMDEAGRSGGRSLYRRLERLDPAGAASIHPNDLVRVTRAIEIAVLTGRLPSEIRDAHGFVDEDLEALKLCLHRPRAELYQRIDARCDLMVEAGLLRETRALLDKGYPPHLKPLQAIGYRHTVKVLRGEWSLAEATQALKTDTRRYAKRQMTWFRGDPEYIWMEAGERERIFETVRRFLNDLPRP